MAAAVKPKGNRLRRLIEKMDVECEKLLGKCKEATLETEVAIFAQCGRWIAVRQKSAEPDQDGEGLLDAYKRTIDTAQGEIAQRAERERAASSKQLYLARRDAEPNLDIANGGAELEALKSRLPHADVHRADVDRGGGGGEAITIAGANRLVRPYLSGDMGGELDEPRRDDEF